MQENEQYPGNARFPITLGSQKLLRFFLLLAGSAVFCFAQTSSFGQAAQGIATEMIAIAKWIGIIAVIVCGLSMVFGGGHGAGLAGKIVGLVMGLILALFAQPIVTWVAGL